jgi:hypothetical protein
MHKIKYLLTDDNYKKYYYLILNDIEYILYNYHISCYNIGAFLIIPNDIFQDLDTMDVVLNNSSLYTIKGEILKYPFAHFNGHYKNENKRKIKLAILLKKFHI